MALLMHLFALFLLIVAEHLGAGEYVQKMARKSHFPAPVAVESSQEWQGNDGLWSTFLLKIGSPAQHVRVLISIGGQETWVVVPEGCSDSAPNSVDCPSRRGGLFNIKASSSWISTTSIWNNSGVYKLAPLLLQRLGIDSSGGYGFDTVSLSIGEGDVSLNRTIVAGMQTSEFYLGQFGVSPHATNFTVEKDNSSSFNDAEPSFFSQLKSRNIIPSLTYSFTAGSYSRSKGLKYALGSMIFGGYDTSLNGSSSLSVGFAEDTGRELVVAVQKIAKTTDATSKDLLPKGILAALDSSQPHIWLPIEACKLFEEAFGITWNSTAQLYMLNTTNHEALISENANITFRLADTITGDSSVEIVFPYSAFDMNASWPLVSDVQPYFPLKRAANETQYTLGRVFMQEAYLIADYENNKFQLSQRTWNDNAKRNIVPIVPTGNTTDSPTSQESKSALSLGAVVGIIIGVMAFISIIAVTVYLRRRRHTGTHGQPEKTNLSSTQSSMRNGVAFQSAEMPSEGAQMNELEPAQIYGSELEGNQEHQVEIDSMQAMAEVDGSERKDEIYELSGA